MFCLCCSPAPSGFKAEGLAPPVMDIANAMRRRAGYDRRKTYSAAPASHPERTDLVIRNVRAVTLDPHLGEIAATDIHIRDGEIVHLGRLAATAPDEIDGSGLTALPGLIAAHRHPWTETVGVAAITDARDLYRVLRLALLEQMAAGVTSIHHCAVDIAGAHAETALLALIDSGLRGLFSAPPSLAERALRELQATWFTAPQEHLVELGFAAAAGAVPEFPEFAMLAATGEHSAEAEPPSSPGHDAAALGMEPWIGSLSPGKRADLILIRGHQPWRERGTELISADEVEMVCIDGRVRKRNGVLLDPNEGLIRREGVETIGRLRQRAAPSLN